jgi:hypothetical protein
MAKEGKLRRILVVALGVLVLAHTIYQFTFFAPGISGFSIGNEKVGEGLSLRGSTSSMIFLIVEWLALISVFTFSYSRYRESLKREYEELKIIKERKLSNKGTALDDLYDLLKEKKELRISTIAKIFNIDKRLAEEWARILESNNFAGIAYPPFGGPKLTLKE